MMAQHWIWPGDFAIFKGIHTSIAKNPYIFVIFQGGGVRTPAPPPPHPSGFARCTHFLMESVEVQRLFDMIKL